MRAQVPDCKHLQWSWQGCMWQTCSVISTITSLTVSVTLARILIILLSVHVCVGSALSPPSDVSVSGSTTSPLTDRLWRDRHQVGFTNWVSHLWIFHFIFLNYSYFNIHTIRTVIIMVKDHCIHLFAKDKSVFYMLLGTKYIMSD